MSLIIAPHEFFIKTLYMQINFLVKGWVIKERNKFKYLLFKVL
jgi:hypothetical protein